MIRIEYSGTVVQVSANKVFINGVIVRIIWTRIADIPDIVTVRILLGRIIDLRTVVACITECVFIRIRLVRVINIRTVVRIPANPISIDIIIRIIGACIE